MLTLTRFVSNFSWFRSENTHITFRYFLSHFLLVPTNGGQYKQPTNDSDWHTGFNALYSSVYLFSFVITKVFFIVTLCTPLIDPTSMRSNLLLMIVDGGKGVCHTQTWIECLLNKEPVALIPGPDQIDSSTRE